MPSGEVEPEERRLKNLEQRLRFKLAELPSAAWAKEATNRRRVRLAAQLRQIEQKIIARRQLGLFPNNQRQEG
jgi:hypothetical protein